MDFAQSAKVQALQEQLRAFMAEQVLPANEKWHETVERGEYPLAVVEPLKAAAKKAGLWNFFLPGLREDEPGTRLTNLEYAPLAEIMGRVPWSSEVFNCSAPDTGNMEILHLFASPEQREHWLDPLLRGEIRSCFSMTEPDVASSDATNLETTIRREGDEYVVNGRKWFSSGALHPNCTLSIVLGRSASDPEAPRHASHSMVLVPLDTPGLRMVRNVAVMNHHAPAGHCELLFRNVRVPASNLLGNEGEGFSLAQARLGPGRVHHCMRAIGQCELALELMCERVLERRTFGKYLSEYANVRDAIARSRIEIDQLRLQVLQAAWRMDCFGNRSASVDVSAIKVAAGELQCRVVDRAMQAFGAMGLTPDTPLADLWSRGRALRLADGPDEVHLQTVARHELKRAREHRGFTATYCRTPQELH